VHFKQYSKNGIAKPDNGTTRPGMDQQVQRVLLAIGRWYAELTKNYEQSLIARLGCEAFWCPCITFGRIHHRLEISMDLQGYKKKNDAVCLPTSLFLHVWIEKMLI
jgi:hypothetical protein